ncbi:DUF2922 domain-containing protein [Clostridium fungisolvens]|uniref:DUF2922 domain-containing protein n=1 Tax=Clostridium fungisolvens TaxID=1604897 RepID=A0A6V8SIK1_9CLOT|nr:DUF2922 domain-containing protein [Clostridium fungisolvens]GFP76402.1 hypothetical protein bsdtw1_02504 [Clostridium fungisolvens]
MESKTLIMIFKNENGDNVSLSVKGVKDKVSTAELTNAMDTIIAKNVFYSSGGKLVQKVGAQLVTKNVDECKVV